MKRSHCAASFLVTCCLILLPFAAADNARDVLNVNYDVLLTVDTAEYQLQSRARVRDGHTLPVDFNRYRVTLDVHAVGDEFSIKLNIFERIDNAWYKFNSDQPGLQGPLGIPAQYVWESGDIKLDLAIVVGRAPG